MKTIAISIDEATLRLLDELATASPRHKGRSVLVRTAVRDFVERERQRATEERESAILHRHRVRLAHQARALLAEQARA